jgi:hypothetical protein
MLVLYLSYFDLFNIIFKDVKYLVDGAISPKLFLSIFTLSAWIYDALWKVLLVGDQL